LTYRLPYKGVEEIYHDGRKRRRKRRRRRSNAFTHRLHNGVVTDDMETKKSLLSSHPTHHSCPSYYYSLTTRSNAGLSGCLKR